MLVYLYVSFAGGERKEEEQRILEELLEVVEQRDALVALLEEDRQKYALFFFQLIFKPCSHVLLKSL